jgi:hypothetical protein
MACCNAPAWRSAAAVSRCVAQRRGRHVGYHEYHAVRPDGPHQDGVCDDRPQSADDPAAGLPRRAGGRSAARGIACCAHRVSSTRCIPYGRILSMRCMLRAAFWRVCRVPPVAAWRRRRVCIFDRICASRPPLLQIVVVVVRTKHTGWRRVLREVRLAARNKQHAAFRHAMRWRRAVDGAPFLRFKSVAVWCRWHVACAMLRSAWCMLAVERCLLSLAR